MLVLLQLFSNRCEIRGDHLQLVDSVGFPQQNESFVRGYLRFVTVAGREDDGY